MSICNLETRVDLPTTTDLGWPTGEVIPYVLGDFSRSAWATPPIYYGTGAPAISDVYATDAAEDSISWEVRYSYQSDDWIIYRNDVAQVTHAIWGQRWMDTDGEVQFGVSKGASNPGDGDSFRFTTYHRGRLPARKLDQAGTLFALASKRATVTSIWAGASELAPELYAVSASRYQGRDIVWVRIYTPTTETVTWCGSGADWNGAEQTRAHEHARLILFDWARPDYMPQATTDWRSLICQGSYRELTRSCCAYQYDTRMVIDQRILVREALERLLNGISSWHVDGLGKIRFIPLDIVTPDDKECVQIRECDVEGWPAVERAARQEVQNRVRVSYDGYGGSSTTNLPWLEIADRRSLRKFGGMKSEQDHRYGFANEAIYHRAGAAWLAWHYLVRHSMPVDEIEVKLPLMRYCHIQPGDYVIYTHRVIPDRRLRSQGTIERIARVQAVTWSAQSQSMTLMIRNLPEDPILEVING